MHFRFTMILFKPLFQQKRWSYSLYINLKIDCFQFRFCIKVPCELKQQKKRKNILLNVNPIKTVPLWIRHVKLEITTKLDWAQRRTQEFVQGWGRDLNSRTRFLKKTDDQNQLTKLPPPQKKPQVAPIFNHHLAGWISNPS